MKAECHERRRKWLCVCLAACLLVSSVCLFVCRLRECLVYLPSVSVRACVLIFSLSICSPVFYFCLSSCWPTVCVCLTASFFLTVYPSSECLLACLTCFYLPVFLNLVFSSIHPLPCLSADLLVWLRFTFPRVLTATSACTRTLAERYL